MMNRASLMIRTCVVMALALVFLGCSKSNGSAPQLNAQGQHPTGWVDTHWISFNQNKAQCTPCHGSYTDASSTGGTSGINCFTCHAGMTPAVLGPQHPSGWATVTSTPFHGTYAKQVASLVGGFAHCAACHGSSYDNAAGTSESCMTCHSKAPHPDKPWHGTTSTGTNHASTDPSNAAECAKCHLNGSNLDPADLAFHGTAAAGTTPGCFNNTMCHGDNPGHVANWASPALHGLKGAMAAPGTTTGFATCATCHGGSAYTGGTGTSCLACHTKAPHPDAPWNSSASITHTGTNQGNLGQCYLCHAQGANSTVKPTTPVVVGSGVQPGCFNGTLCHSTTPGI